MTSAPGGLPGGFADAARRARPLVGAAVLNTVLGIVLTLAVARVLTTSGFGAVTRLFAILVVLQMPGSALIVAVVRRVTVWSAGGEIGRGPEPWARRVRRTAVAAVVAVGLLGLAVQAPLARLLRLPDAGGVVAILVAGSAWALLSVDRGLLQASLAFPALAGNVAVESVIRTILVVGLVAAGTGAGGAAIGVALSVLAADVHARWLLRSRAASTATPRTPPGTLPRPLLTEAGAALATLSLLAVLQGLDVVTVGREEPANAGIYAAVSVASTAVVLLATVLSGYVLPEVTARRHRGERAVGPLAAAVAAVAVPGAGLAVVAALAGRGLLTLVFGARLAGASAALAPAALAMTCLAATVLSAQYLLGVGQRTVIAVLAGGAIVTAAALATAHGDPAPTARTNLVCQAAILAVTSLLVAKDSRTVRP